MGMQYNVSFLKKMQNMYRVAVYGTLRKGGSNHSILSDAKYLGSYETEPKFKMKAVGTGHFPGIIEGGNTSIFMEVYKVSKDTYDSIKTLEGYYGKDNPNNLYNLKFIDTPYRKAIYFEYNNFKSSDINIPSGNWMEHLKINKLKEYA